jgi:NAD(P)-dependent dehydrogenase (short-subunit alcohol dehydrogenase family)
MEKRLSGKTAIVTGASRGIGKAIAFRLADEGGASGVVRPRRKLDGARAYVKGGPLSGNLASARLLSGHLHRQLSRPVPSNLRPSAGWNVIEEGLQSASYYVILELKPEFQRDPAALGQLYLRSSNGSLVPLNEVATMKAIEAQFSSMDATKPIMIHLVSQ